MASPAVPASAGAIKEAPIPFAIMMLLLIGGIWKAIDLRYQDRLGNRESDVATLSQRLGHRDDEIASLRARLEGRREAGGTLAPGIGIGGEDVDAPAKDANSKLRERAAFIRPVPQEDGMYSLSARIVEPVSLTSPQIAITNLASFPVFFEIVDFEFGVLQSRVSMGRAAVQPLESGETKVISAQNELELDNISSGEVTLWIDAMTYYGTAESDLGIYFGAEFVCNFPDKTARFGSAKLLHSEIGRETRGSQ